MKTAYSLVASPLHDYPGHPEGPERLSRLEGWERKPFASGLLHLEAGPARPEHVTAVHTPEMVQKLKEACQRGPGIIDHAPTYVTPGSFDDALNAAGGALACTRAVLDGSARNAFAIVRPPGHHAEPGRAMGFCLFNNLAVAAADALASGVHRILIFDFDVHHGNGTQAAFWNDERVAYFSTHQENIYPGSGRVDEAPHARGRIVNLPLPPRCGDAGFELIAGEVLAPLVRRFAPEMLFVSAGFDAHWMDPLAALGLSIAGFASLAGRLVALAEEVCDGRIVFVLEGGYDREIVAAGVEAVLCDLTGLRNGEPQSRAGGVSPYPEPDIRPRLERLLEWHGMK